MSSIMPIGGQQRGNIKDFESSGQSHEFDNGNVQHSENIKDFEPTNDFYLVKHQTYKNDLHNRLAIVVVGKQTVINFNCEYTLCCPHHRCDQLVNQVLFV
jgi:hypothetical protein